MKIVARQNSAAGSGEIEVSQWSVRGDFRNWFVQNARTTLMRSQRS
jgi:hypothetical protein